MDEHNETNQVKSLVEELNRIKKAAELLEQAQASIKEAALERSEHFEKIDKQISTHTSDLDKTTQNIATLRSDLDGKASKSDIEHLESLITSKSDAIIIIESGLQELKNSIAARYDILAIELDNIKKRIDNDVAISITSFENRILLLEQKDILLKNKLSELRQDLSAESSNFHASLDSIRIEIYNNRPIEKDEKPIDLDGKIQPLVNKIEIIDQGFKSLYNEYVFLHEQFKIIGEMQTIQLKEKVDDIAIHIRNLEATTTIVPNEIVNRLNNIENKVKSIQRRFFVLGLFFIGGTIFVAVFLLVYFRGFLMRLI
jgi:predicted  nucleic acid-binding Zn-ribbon protein